MRFEKISPSDRLKPYIKYFVISENEIEQSYKVLPSLNLVIGFQYQGTLSLQKNGIEQKLAISGITGIQDSFKLFKNSPNIGTVLVFFTEIGFAHFSNCPANELYKESTTLENIFKSSEIKECEERLRAADTDFQRINIVEQFLISNLIDKAPDKLVIEAIKLITNSKGNIRIQELNKKLYTSQSPLEKRFRKIVGTSPKKFSSLLRFHSTIQALNFNKSYIEISLDHNYFDQAHFIKDFKNYMGETPEKYVMSLKK